MTAVGAALGLLAGLGVALAVFSSPPLRRQTLADRLAPHLVDSTAPSRLLAAPGPMRTSLMRRLLQPVLRDAVHLLDRVAGGRAAVQRRLTALGSPQTVEQFRIEQLVWGMFGLGAGLAAAAVAAFRDFRNPLLLLAMVAGCAIAGVLARDWWLTESVSRRHAEMLAEFPTLAEMLALAVGAGEGVLGALVRVTDIADGPLAAQLRTIVTETHTGTSLSQALTQARDATELEPLARFLDGLAVAIDRGTPLAEVLHAQAADVRALGKRQLLESGGRKEIAMMVPVVFLILPITILFAFFPGIIAITTVAQ